MQHSHFTILLKFLLLLLCTGCQTDHGHFIIRNNTSETIRVLPSKYQLEAPLSFDLKPSFETEYLYADDCRILPHSERDFVKDGINWRQFVINNDPSPIYFYVYRLEDIMNMSSADFRRTNPVIHCWIVTRDTMEKCDWTLVYPPSQNE